MKNCDFSFYSICIHPCLFRLKSNLVLAPRRSSTQRTWLMILHQCENVHAHKSIVSILNQAVSSIHRLDQFSLGSMSTLFNDVKCICFTSSDGALIAMKANDEFIYSCLRIFLALRRSNIISLIFDTKAKVVYFCTASLIGCSIIYSKIPRWVGFHSGSVIRTFPDEYLN